MMTGKALPTSPTTASATNTTGRLNRTVTRNITTRSVLPP